MWKATHSIASQKMAGSLDFYVSRQNMEGLAGGRGGGERLSYAWDRPQPLSLPRFRTHQFVSNLVHDVCIVETPSLVLPPALDVDAGLLVKIGQVEIVPGATGRGRAALQQGQWGARTKAGAHPSFPSLHPTWFRSQWVGGG